MASIDHPHIAHGGTLDPEGAERKSAAFCAAARGTIGGWVQQRIESPLYLAAYPDDCSGQ